MQNNIQTFDKATLMKIRAELNEVLAKYGDEAGLEFEIGSIKFSAQSFDVPVSCKIKGGQSRKDEVLKIVMQRHNLQETGLDGRVLKSYNSRQYRYPFVYELNGKMFKCSEESACRYFAKQA